MARLVIPVRMQLLGLLGMMLVAAVGRAQSLGERAQPLPERGVLVLPESLFKPLVQPAVLPFGYPSNEVHKPEILDLIWKRRFDDLETRIGSLRRAVAGDARHETRLFTLYNTLDRDDTTMLASLDAWIDARPRSANAASARAIYHFWAAWRARGKKYIVNTTVAQLRAMSEKAELALQDGLTALDLDSTDLIAYYTILGLAQLGGSQDGSYAFLQRGLAAHPGSYILRSMHMGSLTPRWGGSYAAMAAFAEESQRESRRNPRLVTLRGRVLFEQAFTLVHPFPQDSLQPPNYPAAIDSLTKALQYGPSFEVYLDRGIAYYTLRDYVRAFLDLREAVLLNPQDVEAVTWYGQALVQLASRLDLSIQGSALDRTIEALHLSAYLAPDDSLTVKNLRWARSTREGCLRLVPPCR